MRTSDDIRVTFYLNPLPLSDEEYWTAAQLRVVKRLILLEYKSNPLFQNNPTYYLSRMAQSLTYLPHMGMYQFWLQALANNPQEATVSQLLAEMYGRAITGVTFRHVAYAAYKANRKAH